MDPAPGELWREFGHDPRDPATAGLRASDQDREVARGALTEAYADGRLDRSEYDDRAAALEGTRTLSGLVPLLDDLVPAAPATLPAAPERLRAEAEQRYEAQLRRALATMLVPSLVCLVLWFVGGLGPDGWDPVFPWPLFVVAGTGIRPLLLRLHRADLVAAEQRRLVRKQRKQRKLSERRLPPSGAAPS
jgi:hypothetical protein